MKKITRIMIIIAAFILSVILLWNLGRVVSDFRYNNEDDIVDPTSRELSSQGIRSMMVNGTRVAYLESGKGELILMLHGFPDTPHTYDRIRPLLAREGYHAVAPFSLGYYPTGFAPDDDYSTLALAHHTLEFVDALGYDEFILIGHDWGAEISYLMANLAPDRVKKLVTIAIPHPGAVEPSFEVIKAAPHFVELQFGFMSERLVRKNDFEYIHTLYRRWSPDWKVPEQQFKQVKQTFSHPGVVRAAVSYYKAALKSNSDEDRKKLVSRKSKVPTLIFGSDEGPILGEFFDKSGNFFTGYYHYEKVEGTGHYIHREAPEKFETVLLEFLRCGECI